MGYSQKKCPSKKWPVKGHFLMEGLGGVFSLEPYFCKSVDSVIFLVSFLVSFSVVPERVNSRVGWLLGVLYMYD